MEGALAEEVVKVVEEMVVKEEDMVVEEEVLTRTRARDCAWTSPYNVTSGVSMPCARRQV